MKLIRFREGTTEKPGVIINEDFYDASSFGEDYDEKFFEKDGITRLRDFIHQQKDQLVKLPGDVKLASPVARPSKIICIGLNYIDHARETNATPPSEPVIFLKSTTALCGPYDDVVMPKGSKKTDWEVELAVVIGKKQAM